MPGYRLGEIPIDDADGQGRRPEPFAARALYSPVGGLRGRRAASTRCSHLIDRTEANAMVIDVKETDGNLYYATDLPAAHEVGADLRARRSSSSTSCCRR